MMLKERSKELGGELRDAYGAALSDLLKTNKKIMILDADLGGASFFIRFKKTHPEHFIDVSICEANMFGVAAGLSLAGYTPFVHTMAAFVTRRALDQLYLSCAYSKNTVNIYASDPGFCSGFDGGSHSAFEDLAIMRALMLLYAIPAIRYSWTGWYVRLPESTMERCITSALTVRECARYTKPVPNSSWAKARC